MENKEKAIKLILRMNELLNFQNDFLIKTYINLMAEDKLKKLIEIVEDEVLKW